MKKMVSILMMIAMVISLFSAAALAEGNAVKVGFIFLHNEFPQEL